MIQRLAATISFPPREPFCRAFKFRAASIPGDPGFDQFKKIQESIGYSFTHAFNDIWSFDQNFRYLHSDETVQYVADDVGISSNGQDLLRETYGNHGIDNTITLDNHAAGEVRDRTAFTYPRSSALIIIGQITTTFSKVILTRQV